MSKGVQTVAVMEETGTYVEDFSLFEKSPAGHGPSWLQSLRREAIGDFQKQGFPTLQDEKWKYTNVAPLAKTPFRLAPGSGRPTPEDIAKISKAGSGGWECSQIVFVDGRYAPELSSPDKSLTGVTVNSLAAVLKSEPEKIRPYLTRKPYGDSAFAALNTAFVQDGAFIHIAKGSIVPHPIHILFVATGGGKSTVSYPRNLILADGETQATIVETYAGMDESAYFTNALTQIIAGENASVDYYRVQRESTQAFHVATVEIRQGRNSQVSSCSISLGAGLFRNDLNSLLEAEGGEITLNGLYLTGGKQLSDSHTVIEHLKPHCNSRELYLGLLDGDSRGVFDGKIYVRPDAQKTVARQTNKNLLLSTRALVNTKPQLEIYADDVKCNHGATIGQMDENAMFYLRSRGIGADEARTILTYAFANEVIGLIKVDALRGWMEQVLLARLRQA